MHLRSPHNSAEVCINPEDVVTVSLKHTYISNKLHGVTSQKTANFTFNTAQTPAQY